VPSGTGRRERQDRQRLSCLAGDELLAAFSGPDFSLCIQLELREPTDKPATSMCHGSHPALKHLSYEERLRELSLFNLKKRRL